MQSDSTTPIPPEQPATPIRVCPIDGASLNGRRSTAKYCSDRCKWRADNLSRRSPEKQPPMTPAEKASKTRQERALAAKILELYFGDPPQSRTEVAAKLGITEGQVNYLIKKYGHKLRPRGEAIRLSATGRSRRGSVAKWPIVERRRAGKLKAQIARELKSSPTAISTALHRMGWPSKACHSFGGEEFDRPALERLLQMSDFDVPQLARKLSMPGLVNSTRKPDWRLHFDHAQKIAEWWKRFFRWLMDNASTQKGRRAPRPLGGYGQANVIVRFFPTFSARYTLLLDVLERLAEDEGHRLAKKLAENEELRKNPEKYPEWQRKELKEYLCEAAVRETTGKSPGLFVQFLPWAVELMPHFPENLQDLHVVHRQLLAYKILTGWLGATKGVIPTVLSSATRQIEPIPASQMRELILLHGETEALKAKLVEAEAKVERLENQPQPKAPKGEKRDPGRHKAAKEKKMDYKVGAAVQQQLPLFDGMFEIKKATPVSAASATLRSRGFTEEQINAALSSKTPTIAARKFISNTYVVKVKGEDKFLEYDTVKKYHLGFLKLQRLPGTKIAA